MGSFFPALGDGVVTSGSYVGDGTANRAILHSLGGRSPLYVVINKSDAHLFYIVPPGWIMWLSAGGDSASAVTAVDSTNFYVGNSGDYGISANNSGTTYYWVAFA